MKIVLMLICCLALFVSPLTGQEKELSIDHTIESTYPNEQRQITVNLPRSYYSQTEYKYPVLYVLDGENNLRFSAAVAEYLSDNGLIPEMIIVGVHGGGSRSRDYVPKVGGERAVNGANQFLSYLEKELVPFIEGKYRSAPLRILSGHSYGGLFALYAMVKSPDLFDGFLIQSPFVDQANGDPFVKHLGNHWGANKKSDLFVFANIGEEPNLESNYSKIEALMKSYSTKSQQLISNRERGKTHMTTRLGGTYDGLELFFKPDWPLTEKQLMASTADGIKKHIDNLSQKYGYDVLYDEQVLAKAAQLAISKREFESSLNLASLLIQQRPNSVLGHFFLAVSQASSGERQESKTSIATAIKLFEGNPNPALQALVPQMKALQLQLK